MPKKVALVKGLGAAEIVENTVRPFRGIIHP